jgi:hypothetical protein
MSEALWDAPNQQVVREDASPPWEEGTGGNVGDPDPQLDTLEQLSKDDLLAKAQAMGLSPANAAMTKAELAAAIEAAGG